MWKKILGYGLLVLIGVVAAAFAWLYLRKPAMAAPRDIQVEVTPERVERGRYLFALADCGGCHSPHDEQKLYMPEIEARRGSGRTIVEEGESLPIPNITPDRETGIGGWSDGEKMRAIREGIGKDGRALFPMMPYELYRHMSDEDVESLVAYLNTLAPVKSEVKRLELPLPVKLLIKGAPRPVTQPVKTPDRSDPRVYGEYLTTIGVCEGCHTPFDRGSFDMSKRLAGGRRFRFGEYEVVTPNLTPDRDTGIGNWTAEYFRERFHRFREYESKPIPAMNREQFTIMPWLTLAKLPSEDLDAIYTYLMSRPPVSNKVDVHPVAVAQK